MPDELDVFIEQQGIANTLYYFAEALTNHALLDGVGAADKGAALIQFRREVVEIAGHFIRFGQAFMSAVFTAHGPSIWKGEAEPVDLGELPSFREMQFPWFTDAAGIFEDNETA